ncbi:MAG: bifunctional 4-hydroxy-3-methylbut-2-enyl diphosphate reductase/30S ribosomal protein S1 [Eubacteriales bacterium]
MKITLAKHGGFCFGVQRALDKALEMEKEKIPTSTFGPIIHNPLVVDMLEEKGIRSVENIDDCETSHIIIRSHGVSPEIYQECEKHSVNVVDATCPYVRKIQKKAKECRENSIELIIIGEKLHPETVGINGWYGSNAMVINSVEEAEKIDRMQSACVVAQTTTPEERFDDIIEILKGKVDELEIFNSICSATKQRQKEAVSISEKSDIVFVVGGKNSSNTRKLFEICKEHCDNVYHIETTKDIPELDYREYDNLGIISGASTPEWIIKEVYYTMSDIEKVEQTEVTEEKVVAEESVPVEDNKSETTADVSAEESANASFMEDVEKSMVQIKSGMVVKGKVVSVNEDEVCVNIGYKADGLIKRKDFSNDENESPVDVVKEGDEIEVEVVRVRDEDGNVILSRKNIEARKNWKKLLEKIEEGGYFVGVGKQAIKGGLIAEIEGVRAFVPASHLDVRYVNDISEYVGKEMDLKILEVEKHRRRVVASRKDFILEKEKEVKSELWDQVEEGITVRGVVRRLTNFGAFVDIGGIDGLVHVTDLAWGRVEHPKDVVSINEEIDVVVLKVDKERERISLGYKQTKPKPWDTVDENYIIGSVVSGKVVRIVDFGAFIELEPGLDGLIHISQIADKRIEKVEDVLELGQTVEAKVLDVNATARRISLSIRELIAPSEPKEETSENEGYDEEASSVKVDISKY